MSKNIWTEEELKYLVKHWHTKPNLQIAKDLNKTESAVRNKASKYITFEMMSKRRWSEYEENLLSKLYATIPIEELCNRMKRSRDAIYNKLEEIEGTTNTVVLQSLYTTVQVSEFLGVSDDKVRMMISKNEIPMYKVNGWRYVINQNEFWSWLEKNLHIPNYKKIKDEAELESTEWYRKIIKENKRNMMNDKKGESWTSKDDALLWAEMMKGTSYKKIAEMLNRSYRGVTGRARKLSMKRMSKAS